MPVTTLNISSIPQLSHADILALQQAARRESEIRVFIGSGQYSIHHILMPDWFSVEPLRGGILDRLLRREHRMEDRAFVLEWQLNHIRASIDISGNYIQDAFSGCRERNSDVIKLQSKLTSCMFSLNSAGFSCPESFLTCPITLCVPEVGVFMKNSRDSNICSLYDKESLSYLIKTSAPHPLSREVITESMIVGKDECRFEPIRGNFILKNK
ncbi:T3SS effector NleG family protein [Escherichia albertii]|nr:T3SS effector NleG family protein [Escherichia albertii]